MTNTIHSKSLTTVPADRCIYLMSPGSEKELLNIEDQARTLAQEGNYEKIVGKVPDWGLEALQARGYQLEAQVPGLYGGSSDGYFVANYQDPQRKHCDEKALKILDSVKTIANATRQSDEGYELPEKYALKFTEKEDRQALLALYQRSFLDYPNPEDFETFITHNDGANNRFYVLCEGEQLIEAVRLAIFPEEGHAELSDFATHPDFRGKNLSYHLIRNLLDHLQNKDIATLYGLPRASSYGLNITFSKLGFHCGGTLRNTRRIGSNLESLNVWYTPLKG